MGNIRITASPLYDCQSDCKLLTGIRANLVSRTWNENTERWILCLSDHAASESSTWILPACRPVIVVIPVPGRTSRPANGECRDERWSETRQTLHCTSRARERDERSGGSAGWKVIKRLRGNVIKRNRYEEHHGGMVSCPADSLHARNWRKGKNRRVHQNEELPF